MRAFAVAAIAGVSYANHWYDNSWADDWKDSFRAQAGDYRPDGNTVFPKPDTAMNDTGVGRDDNKPNGNEVYVSPYDKTYNQPNGNEVYVNPYDKTYNQPNGNEVYVNPYDKTYNQPNGNEVYTPPYDKSYNAPDGNDVWMPDDDFRPHPKEDEHEHEMTPAPSSVRGPRQARAPRTSNRVSRSSRASRIPMPRSSVQEHESEPEHDHHGYFDFGGNSFDWNPSHMDHTHETEMDHDHEDGQEHDHTHDKPWDYGSHDEWTPSFHDDEQMTINDHDYSNNGWDYWGNKVDHETEGEGEGEGEGEMDTHEHDSYNSWGYGADIYKNPYSFQNDGHDHSDNMEMQHGDHSHHDGSVQDHTHEHGEENDHHHHDWADLQDAFLALKMRSDALKEGRLLHDHFVVNEGKINLDLTKPHFEIAGPFCIEEGETMELSFSATLEELADNVVGFALVKNDGADPVAVSRLADNEGPSSLSLLYRETAAEDATFSLYFTLAEPVEPEHEPHYGHGYGNHYGHYGHGYGHGYGHYEPKVPEYNIAPQNIQMGVKIYAEGYTPVSSDTSGLQACESAGPQCAYETGDFVVADCAINDC